MFEGDFSNLKHLSFTDSNNLETIEGLEHLTHLTNLNISGTSKLKSLTFGENNKDLDVNNIEMKGSGVTAKSIRGFRDFEEF